MKKSRDMNLIEITKESGEVVLTEQFPSELSAQNHFDNLEKIKSPNTYLNYTMNLREYHTGGTIGTVRVVVKRNDKVFIRRELFRTA